MILHSESAEKSLQSLLNSFCYMQQLLLAATKSDAEAAYNKENKEPKQSAKLKPPHKKTKKAETVPNKPLEKEKQTKKAEKGKQTSEKKKSQAQEE